MTMDYLYHEWIISITGPYPILCRNIIKLPKFSKVPFAMTSTEYAFLIADLNICFPLDGF